MNKVLLIGLLLSSVLLHAQTTQKGIVVEQNSGKNPVSGVQVIFTGSQPTSSDNSGNFNLLFSKNEGSVLNFEEVSKVGYELVNEPDLQSVVLSSKKQLQIVLCRAGLLSESRMKYFKISKKTITDGYEQKLAELNQQKANWQQEKDSLTALYEQQLKDANRLAEQFARTNFDDVSDLFKRAFDLFQNGKIDSAIIKLEQANLITRADKRIQERSAIDNLQTNLNQRRQENEQGIQQDMQAIRLQVEMYIINPNNYELYKNLGESYYKLAGIQVLLNRFQEAIKNYEKSGEIYVILAETRKDESYKKFYELKIKPEIDKLKK